MTDHRFLPTTFEGWLFKLAEELGEVGAAVGKTGRHGLWSVNPLSSGGGPRWEGYGCNAAVALAIACLKAIQASHTKTS